MSDTNGGPVTIALVALEAKRVDDLRTQAERRIDERDEMRNAHRLELATAEAKRLDANALAEKERVNALLAAQAAAAVLANAEARSTASALAIQVETTRKAAEAQVEASAAALRATNEATALALGSRIQPLEEARFANVGIKEHRTEGRATNQYVIYLLLAGLAIASFIIARVTP